jgi:hypothetical protein
MFFIKLINDTEDIGSGFKFDIEMTLMTELPELYNSYPWLIKSFSKSEPSEFMKMMNKMLYTVFLLQFLIICTFSILSMFWMNKNSHKNYLNIEK